MAVEYIIAPGSKIIHGSLLWEQAHCIELAFSFFVVCFQHMDNISIYTDGPYNFFTTFNFYELV